MSRAFRYKKGELYVSDFEIYKKLKQFVEQASEDVSYTPDANKLFRKDKQLVLLFDNIKIGHKFHRLIESGEYYGRAFTKKEDYVMWIKFLGSETFPIALPKEDDYWKGAIKGELYLIDTYHLLSLDDVIGNVVQYTRVKVPIVLPYRNLIKGKVTTTSELMLKELEAWVYIGIEEYWRNEAKTNRMIKPGTCYISDREGGPLYFEFTKEDIKNP
jgi:gamma-glutamylcyclotransferase (GGCT)/AIG2-like uncharacterized protein YtfP